ncbi:sulfotransferase [Psychroserpens sp. XS_ASV72]|uniref:sulfotransferase family protein n=1 Tax=Psychroserpens sp. XS_ASV72 TaxID=3241293 RepID=UPI0035138AA7
MKQVFIFSLPRSGSTLMQRTLMAHKDIASTAEPWILLPQIYGLKEKGSLSEYGSMLAAKAINDLIENLPNKQEDYDTALRNFIVDIQSKLSKNNESYFLDKTPRYYLIIDEIHRIFPEAKFIFLFRSPEQIYTSMLSTWANNRLRPFLDSYNDIVVGYKMLSQAYRTYQLKSIAINYESFVEAPESQLKNIMSYLDLEYDESMINKFSSQETKGSLGDPTGIKDYKTISINSLAKWKQILDTNFRKRVACKLINKIDSEDLKAQGYDKSEIINSIKSIKTKTRLFTFTDWYDYYLNLLIRRFNLHLYFAKSFKWLKGKFMS